MRVQLLGSTRLSRVVLPYVLERRGVAQGGGPIVGIDLGEEDESLPWFAPIRGLARDNGVSIGRHDAERVLDLDPDARPVRLDGVGLRVLPPPGAASGDLNRALLSGGEWEVVVTDGVGAWARRPVPVREDDDAVTLLDRGTRLAVEALDEAWEHLHEPPPPLPRPLSAGRFRAQETFVIWEQPAARVIARIRACAGPYGGARTHIGDTTVWLLDACLVDAETPAGWAPGTILAIDRGLIVATGRGTVRVERLRPGWRPPRSAGGFAEESRLSPGYLFT